MRSRAVKRVVGFLVLALVGANHVSLAQNNLRYQNRGRYSEGVRTEPRTGATIDLVGALINQPEPYQEVLPSNFHALFYLPVEEAVYLAIREVEPEYFYWLGDVQPEAAWRAGKTNEFRWSTATVIHSLNWKKEPLTLNDLAATARLGRPTPGKVERVAPVVLYHSRTPQFVESYRFLFRPSARMRLSFDLFADGKTDSLASQPFPRLPAEKTHPVVLDARKWAQGWYRIVITGYVLSNSEPIDSEVRFYHTPTLRP